MEKNYYENLKNESYKTMLDSEIQASVARDQAMKYTQNQINGAGYGNQGLAQSTMLGVQNNYRNALRDAAAAYDKDMAEIQKEEADYQIKQDDNVFKSASTLMSNATSQDYLQQIYDTYKDDPSLDDNSKKQLDLLYNMYGESFAAEEQDKIDTSHLFDIDKDETFTYYEDGKQLTAPMGSDFDYEMKSLQSAIRTNSVPDDSYILLINDDDGNTLEDYEKSNKRDAEHIYLKFVGGKLYYVSDSDYRDNATDDNAYVIIEKNAIQKKKVDTTVKK